MIDKPRANRDRWSNDTDPKDAARLEIEAKRHGLDPVIYEMSRAVPTSVVRDLVNDARSFSHGQKPRWDPQDDRPAPIKGPIAPTPLGPYSGQNIIDRMCEAQARRDAEEEIARRIEIARRLNANK